MLIEELGTVSLNRKKKKKKKRKISHRPTGPLDGSSSPFRRIETARVKRNSATIQVEVGL